MMPHDTPRATLRLQFHRGFTFADGIRHVGWYARMGVSHVYASPLGMARSGSTHGYDVIDPTRINPELGGEEGLRAFAARLRVAGMGIMLDIVPNHMAADPANLWWADVLRHGRASRHASWFDIDWEAPGCDGKVLLPVLGGSLEDALTSGDLTLGTDGDGRPALRLGTQTWPLAEGSADGRDDLVNLLARQHYRFISWRSAGDLLNWRRFFDINELVCLRMERADAFDAVHALPLRLFADGVIDGLRVDHVDGLTDPAGYCRRLRTRLDDVAARHDRPRAWLVVEKILLKDETLATDWDVDGTTGYDFMNDVSALQHDGTHAAGLAEAWSRLSGRSADFAPEETGARREIIARSFSAQLETCAASFECAMGAIVPRPTLRRLLGEVLAYMPVYRTYAADGALPPADALLLREVGRRVARSCIATDRWAVAPLLAAMLAEPASPAGARAWQRAMASLQQLSAPIAAKSVEDTAFYRFGRLLSRNDVGFDADSFSLEPDAFHGRVAVRQSTFPRAMLATATHDHKRGEDLRARLAVVSECAHEWTLLQARWTATASPLCADAGERAAPTPGDIAMLLQMVVGGWPLDLDFGDSAGRTAFAARLAAWQEKALREAKLVSDWADVDAGYEAAARALALRLVGRAELPELLREIFAFIQRIAPAGAVNGLAQCLLKLTVPGVPDLYQGTDLWDFSLVDPDNRRPVDFDARAAMSDGDLASLAATWRDGRLKQHLIRRALALRRQAPHLFADGDYRPLPVEGPAARSVVTFARRARSDWLMVIVPRHVHGQLVSGDRLALTAEAWKDTIIRLDAAPQDVTFHDWLGGGVVELLHRNIRADLLTGTIPLALVSTVAPSPDLDC